MNLNDSRKANPSTRSPDVGATIWITGLPAAGKTSLACALDHTLAASGHRTCLLDGDDLRRQRWPDLGFDRASRAEMVGRVARLAYERAQSGTIAIVALVSPYAADRRVARVLHRTSGLQFVEIFLDTPLWICEQRDPKGLYARARRGELVALTGVDDPYEPPDCPDLHLPVQPLHVSVHDVLGVLTERGVLSVSPPAGPSC